MCQYQVAFSKNGLKVEVYDVLRTLRQVSATVRTLCLEDDLRGRIVDGCHQDHAYLTPNVYKWGVNMNTNEAVKAMAHDFLLSCNLCSRLSA